MLKIERVSLVPQRFTLDEGVEVAIRKSTLADEGKRFQLLFKESTEAMLTDIAMVEMWLTVEECNIVDMDEKPLIGAGMNFIEFQTGANSIWTYSPELFWEIHQKVRETNPQWEPGEEAEGNG